MKPSVEITNSFRNSSKEIVIRNPKITKFDIETNFESIRMLNRAIPEIRNALNEYKLIKVHVVFHLSLMNIDLRNKDERFDIKDIPSGISIKTITNILTKCK